MWLENLNYLLVDKLVCTFENLLLFGRLNLYLDYKCILPNLTQNELRSSLVLSMLNSMLHDDKDEDVKDSVTRSLALLTGFIDDSDKYSQVSHDIDHNEYT